MPLRKDRQLLTCWGSQGKTRLATCPHADNYQMEPVQTPMATNQLVIVTLKYEWVT